jgi:hypothetical protein
MFPRPDRIVLWKYADDTPVEKLLRHYRIARAIAYVWITSSVMMVSANVEFLFSSKGMARDVKMAIALVATAVGLLSAIPGILSVAWAAEIEAPLSQRGYPPPARRPIGPQVGIMAMKMCFWFAVLILGIHLLK